ncbi:hypothetical protein [Microbaculum marinisediminis]|uniref:Uncharacterized protein n=1 Tax=Microbaculum marinisediminis TaxID=2931392 RepID=A0AAW5R2M0_9HYPH|nr:hypothetical protein [Microbaculum sp. A6E488]MCT8973615.1 hypothetical protein [Microbaculum sp. A6E488]
MLGDIIARLGDKGTAEAVLIEAGELALLAEVREAARSLDMEADAFASLAVRRFVERADDDAWLHLVGVMGRSETPGLDALSTILRRAVADAREAVA